MSNTANWPLAMSGTKACQTISGLVKTRGHLIMLRQAIGWNLRVCLLWLTGVESSIVSQTAVCFAPLLNSYQIEVKQNALQILNVMIYFSLSLSLSSFLILSRLQVYKAKDVCNSSLTIKEYLCITFWIIIPQTTCHNSSLVTSPTTLTLRITSASHGQGL